MGNKAWYESKGVWGVVIGIAAFAADKLGFTLTTDGLDADIVQVVGMLIALYGRLTAKQAIK